MKPLTKESALVFEIHVPLYPGPLLGALDGALVTVTVAVVVTAGTV